jgi:hypothetical protein
VVQHVPEPMKMQAGIKLLNQVEGYGDPIQDSDRFDAVLKFYRNKGDPLEFDTILQDPIPYVVELNGKPTMAWHAPKMHRSNVVYERDRVLGQTGRCPSWHLLHDAGDEDDGVASRGDTSAPVRSFHARSLRDRSRVGHQARGLLDEDTSEASSTKQMHLNPAMGPQCQGGTPRAPGP